MSDSPEQTTTTTTTLRATCLCHTTHLSLTLPHSALPLPTHFCHCPACRHTHGSLFSVHATIPKPDPAPATSWDSLTPYQSSEHVTRWFCRGCGAQVVDCAGEGTAQEEWHVAAALVDAPEEAWGFWGHLFVSGMGGGGGMAGLMPFINGRRMQLLEGNIGSRSMDVKELGVGEGGMFGGEEAGGGKGEEDGELEKGKERKKGKVLRAECYCKGVRFSILPPSSPAAFDAFPPAERSIVPRDKTKWYALHDPCTSCRLASGSPILSWLFTTRPHLQLPDGSPWPQYHVFGTVRVYESSEGVKRVWCGRCGAKVAYVHESRPEVVDVAVGLLVDEGDGEGVLHKGSLEWRTGLSEFKGDAVWKGVVGALEEGILAAGMEGRV